MTNAVIFQSTDSTANFVRQTAIIPTDGLARTFTRVIPTGAQRADWLEIGASTLKVSPFGSQEVLQGRPVSLPVTDADRRDLEALPKPTTLLQKLVRSVEAYGGLTLTNCSADGVWDDLVVETEKGLVGKYIKGVAPFTGDVTPVAPAPAPAVALPVQVVVEPEAPVAPPVAPQPAPQVLTADQPLVGAVGIVEASLSVPTAEQVGDYIVRTIDDLPEPAYYAFAKAERQPVLVLGDAGTGKTSSARHIAHLWQVPFVQLECTPTLTETDVVGQFVPTSEKGVAVWRDSELVTAIQQPSVVLLNELSRMSSKSASYFLRLLQEGEVYIKPLGRTIKVHPECLIIADMNIGYKGVTPQDEALLTRFRMKVEFEYDPTIERNFIPSDSLLELATKLRGAYKRKEIGFPVSTRALIDFVKQAKGLNFAFAVRSFLTNFGERDRQAVLDVLHTFADGIAKDLGVDLGSFVLPDIEVQTV